MINPGSHELTKKICVFAVVIAMMVFTLSGCKNESASRTRNKTKTPTRTEQERPTSVVLPLDEPENEEYDVSAYRIQNRTFYEEPQTVITQDQLKEYAESKLDTVTLAADGYFEGTYQGYKFTIVGVDSFTEWLEYMDYSDRNGDQGGLQLWHHRGNLEYEVIEFYKDPSGNFLAVTQCRDYKVICEFFER